MKKAGIPIVVLALLGAWLVWWMSPAQVVKRKTEDLVGLLCFDGGGGPGLMEMHQLAGLLGQEVDVEIPILGVGKRSVSRDDAQSGYAGLRRRAKSSAFEVTSIHGVDVVDDRAEVTATLSGTLTMSRLRVLDGDYRVTFVWQDSGKGWLLTGVVWQVPLKR